jgi:hypothetical protein
MMARIAMALWSVGCVCVLGVWAEEPPLITADEPIPGEASRAPVCKPVPGMDVTVKTTVPVGEYQLANLSLEDTVNWPLNLAVGLRDGKATMVWFQSSETIRYWPLEKSLELRDGKLKGQVAGHDGGSGPDCNRFVVEIDATVSGRAVSGTFRHSLTGKLNVVSSGKVTGNLVDGQPLAANRDWPHFFGKAGQYSHQGPESGAALVTDLSQAKPVWKSEAWIYTSWGNGPARRYSHVSG